MSVLVHELQRHREGKRDGEGARKRKPSSVVVGAVRAGVADPLQAPVLESFAGAIDSVEEVGAVETVAASRHWLRPFSDQDQGVSVGKWRLRLTSYLEPADPHLYIYSAV
jgi:hypothetical protein